MSRFHWHVSSRRSGDRATAWGLEVNFVIFVADAVLRSIRQSCQRVFELDLMSRVHWHESSRRSGDRATAGASEVNLEIFVADAVLWSIRQVWPTGF